MLLLVTAAFLPCSAIAASQSGPCPEQWTDASFVDMGCLFFNVTHPLSWIDANEHCQMKMPERNSSLVDIRTAEQLAFLQMLLDFGDHVQGVSGSWIAGTDVGSSGSWFWATTRTPVDDFIWADGEPSRGTGTVSLTLTAKLRITLYDSLPLGTLRPTLVILLFNDILLLFSC